MPLLEAARRGFAERRIYERHVEHQERRARPVRLCDAGAVQDRRERGVLQRYLSSRGRDAAQDGRDDARRARRRAVLSLPRAVDARPMARSMAATSCPRRPWSPKPFEAEAFGIDGAVFAAEPDPETNFKLFGPVAVRATGAKPAGRAFALRLRPNQDFAGALEAFCRQHGIFRARHPWRRRQHHRRAFYRWPQRRAVRD